MQGTTSLSLSLEEENSVSEIEEAEEMNEEPSDR